MVIDTLLGTISSKYESLERKTILGFDRRVLADVSVTPPLLLPKIVKQATGSLRDTSVFDLLRIFRDAAEIFTSGTSDGTDAQTYIRNVSLSTGLPTNVVRQKSVEFFDEIFRQIDTLLKMQTGLELDVFDTLRFARHGRQLGYPPRAKHFGVIMPGNHPSTHNLWLIALAMKIPVLVRPSFEDVFTPYRLITSLYQAGLPTNALYFLPGNHALADGIIQQTSLSMIFGGQSVLEKYRGKPNVKVYGPGRSKVLVPCNADIDVAVDTICRLIMDDAGRGCINASAVIIEGDARPIASEVARRMNELPFLSPLDEESVLPAALSRETALSYDEYIHNRLANGIILGHDSCFESIDDTWILRPTVVHVPSPVHPLFGVELPFPFAVFTSVDSRETLLHSARGSLSVVTIGADDSFLADLLLEPTISKVYAGQLSTEFDAREPHEGYIADFLFEHKAFR